MGPFPARLSSLLAELDALIAELEREAVDDEDDLAAINPSYRESALNLLQYLVLRRRDARPIQAALSDLGLSSLGRSEAGVLHSVRRVRDLVAAIAGVPRDAGTAATSFLSSAEGLKLLQEHTAALLGPAPRHRDVRIMVTMPSEAATHAALVRDMVLAGMDCMRINCAHDGPAEWQAMIGHARRASAELGRPCRIMMDLGGPKLRTGPVAPGPRVLKLRPSRDLYGRVIQPVRLWLTAGEAPAEPPIPGVPALELAAAALTALAVGDELWFRDARDARRRFGVTDVFPGGCWAECAETAYVVPETRLYRSPDETGEGIAVAGLPAREQAIVLARGDTLILTRELVPGVPATYDAAGAVVEPARIGCTLPEAFDAVRPGEPIWFDDGKIGGEIAAVAPDRLTVTITQARSGGARLRAEKGINLPESDLPVPALTAKDREDLAFVAQHADLVGFSFVSRARDVLELQGALRGLTDRPIGIVLKIETRRAFEHLPDLLLAAMHGPSAGIMIARGDLAIECGFERLAEVQEEILWVAEAAHMPVIWATQVLESLAQTGLPSRSEITDAAMGQRAECVMLNKGPYVVEAIRLLDGILQRMQAHQSKKRALLRRLRSWTDVALPAERVIAD